MSSNQKPTASIRRVWRMSPDAPLGEYVEVPATEQEAKADRPRRRASDFAPLDGLAASTSETPRRRAEDQAPATARVLNPAQAENWQSSSFDLLSGCKVRDVSDTIPGNVFDELFGEPEADLAAPPRRLHTRR